jgi:molecular chaperone HscB
MNMLCWKCKEQMQGLVCVGCSAIRLPPPRADYFEVFGLERRYFLDSKEVQSAHLRLAKILHPDRWRQSSAVERRMSKQWMALVNEGLRVLQDSIQRARYLATGSATVSETGGKMDSGFLETIFELQMRAMEEPEVVKLEAQTMLNACTSDLEAIFRHWEESKGDLSMVEDCLGQMKYLNNLVNRP